MAFPDNTEKGGRGKKAKTIDLINGFDKSLLSRARYVLRNSPMVEGERYPRMLNGIQAAFTLSTFPNSRRNSSRSVPVADTSRPRMMPAR